MFNVATQDLIHIEEVFGYRGMGHGDFTFQIVATLTGAGFVSLLLIVLINAEAKHRIQNPEPEIQNVNLWDLIKSKLSGFTHNLMRTNRTVERKEESSSWQQSAIASRGLKWVDDQPTDDDEKNFSGGPNNQFKDSKTEEPEEEKKPHPVRHGHSRQHQLLLLELQHKKAKSNKTTIAPDDVLATTTHSKRDLCYSGNQVLVVIGLTCLLNFAFVLVVVACVHYLNRVGSTCVDKHMSPGSMSRYDSMESETEEVEGRDTVSLKPLCPRCPPSHSMERLLFID